MDGGQLGQLLLDAHVRSEGSYQEDIMLEIEFEKESAAASPIVSCMLGIRECC